MLRQLLEPPARAWCPHSWRWKQEAPLTRRCLIAPDTSALKSTVTVIQHLPRRPDVGRQGGREGKGPAQGAGRRRERLVERIKDPLVGILWRVG